MRRLVDDELRPRLFAAAALADGDELDTLLGHLAFRLHGLPGPLWCLDLLPTVTGRRVSLHKLWWSALEWGAVYHGIGPVPAFQNRRIPVLRMTGPGMESLLGAAGWSLREAGETESPRRRWARPIAGTAAALGAAVLGYYLITGG